MHPNFERADDLSAEVIGAAVEVHRTFGPGLINFHNVRLTDGVSRLIVPGANRPARFLTEGNEGNEEKT